jgi:hypothetical protein
MSKQNQIVVALFLLSSLFLTSVRSQTPYFLSFYHEEVKTCVDVFVKIRDNVYIDYVNDLIATSNMTSTIATQIDSDWSTTTYKFPTSTDLSSRLLSASRSLQSCPIPCNSHINLIIVRGCCDICTRSCRRRKLEASSDKAFRDLQTTSLRDVEPVRDSTGFIVVKSEGNMTVSQSRSNTLQGTSIAREFYQSVQKNLLDSDRCKGILLATTYKVMEMKVVSL